ncbi:hypothetical protein ACVW0W_004942 [Bradyrhizobium sp. USDA 4469]
MSQTVAVLDIGKTNVKLAVFSDGRLLWEKSAPNRVLAGPPYPHEDVESAWTFFLDALREAARTHQIGAIVPTAHGAAGALIGESELAAPVMDYEFAGVEAIEPDYAGLRPSFSESLSPKVPAGLNLGRQLAYQKWRCPDLFAEARYFVGYPQYWTWRLSGVAVSEVTSLGAHTDLWAPRRGQVSSLVKALGVDHLLPPLRRAFDPLGPIRPEIAALTGLAPETQVFCGIHDSNASLLPYLVSRQAPFTVLSTGTWVILMCVGLSLDQLDPRDDTLANVDALGRPIACGRFMGGREYATIAGSAGQSGPWRDRAHHRLGRHGPPLLLRAGRPLCEDEWRHSRRRRNARSGGTRNALLRAGRRPDADAHGRQQRRSHRRRNLRRQSSLLSDTGRAADAAAHLRCARRRRHGARCRDACALAAVLFHHGSDPRRNDLDRRPRCLS